MGTQSSPCFVQVKRSPRSHLALGFCIATAMLIVGVRAYVARKLRQRRPGSVADLVRRGQLNSDRRGMYDSNPFFDFSLFLNQFVYVDGWTHVWVLSSLGVIGWGR